MDGVNQLITQSQNFCLALNPSTGALLWRIPYTTAYDQNIVTPVVYNQTVIFSGIDKGTTAIRPRQSNDAWTTEQLWHNPDVSMYMSSPVLSNHLLFALSHKRRGQFFCLDARTGKLLWTSPGRQGENATLILAGPNLFLLTTNATLIAIPAHSTAFTPLAQYPVATTPTWTHPVILKNQVLVKSQEALALWSFK